MFNQLVNLIQTQSEDLTSNVVDDYRSSSGTPKYKNVPPEDLRHSLSQLYHCLADWLLTPDEPALKRRFLRIGSERARQDVPFSQVVWAANLAKVKLWEFLHKREVEERLVKTYADVDLLQQLDDFFDRMIYYLAVGYEQHSTSLEDTLKIPLPSPKSMIKAGRQASTGKNANPCAHKDGLETGNV
jgi:hypothetical protein